MNIGVFPRKLTTWRTNITVDRPTSTGTMITKSAATPHTITLANFAFDYFEKSKTRWSRWESRIEIHAINAESVKRNSTSHGKWSVRCFVWQNWPNTTAKMHGNRQSTGEFSGIAPNLASHMIMTSDTLISLNEENYDCMFQSLLISSQVSAVTRHFQSETDMTYHFHIGCQNCVPNSISESRFFFDQPSGIIVTWGNFLRRRLRPERNWITQVTLGPGGISTAFPPLSAKTFAELNALKSS